MRYIFVVLLPLLICSCVPQPNPVVEKWERIGLKLNAVLCQQVSAQSAYQHKDITKVIKDEKNNSTITVSTKYVEPFQGCARYNTSSNYVKTGFLGNERNHNFIFKVCETEKEQIFSIELLAPDVPEMTGIKDEIDISKINTDDPSNS